MLLEVLARVALAKVLDDHRIPVGYESIAGNHLNIPQVSDVPKCEDRTHLRYTYLRGIGSNEVPLCVWL